MNERINDSETSKEYFNPDYQYIRLLNTRQVFIIKYKSENNMFRFSYFRVCLLCDATTCKCRFCYFFKYTNKKLAIEKLLKLI